MKSIRVLIIFLMLLAAAAGALAQSAPDEKMFQDIKLLIFDEKWGEAQVRLEDFLARYPRSPFTPQALFYKSKALEKQEGKEREALGAYKEFLRLGEKNANLAEDAEGSVIELAMRLYDRGDKGFVRDVEDRLTHPAKAVRYFAAVQLSYVKEKRIADKSIPVLKEIIEGGTGSDLRELRDRARIALLRVSPEALAETEDAREDRRGDKAEARRPRILKVSVQDDRTRKIEFSLELPWALADLVLAAIPEETKVSLRARGHDVTKILRDLQSGRGTVFSVTDAKEGKTFKIWIE